MKSIGQIDCALCLRPLPLGAAIECGCGAIVCKVRACFALHLEQQHIEAVV